MEIEKIYFLDVYDKRNKCVTYDSSVGFSVDGTQAFQLHHGFDLFSLLTASLQVSIKEIHHLHHIDKKNKRHHETQNRARE